MLFEGGANGGDIFVLNLAHQFADELHLAAAGLKTGQALVFRQGIGELFRQVQALQRFGVQLQQGFAQGLQGIALFFLIGAGGVVGIAQAFEFGFEFQIAGAAFGNEFAFDVIAFFWFAGHE